MLKVLRRPFGLILFFKKREKGFILNSTPLKPCCFLVSLFEAREVRL